MKLNDFVDGHAATFGMAPSDLAELRRLLALDPSLRDAGFRRERPGPGGGADASPRNVALLAMAALAAAVRTQAHRVAWEYFHLPHAADRASGQRVIPPGEGMGESVLPVCGLTGAALLGDALALLVSDPDLAGRVDRIEVRRDVAVSAIYWTDRAGDPQCSRFGEEADIDGADRADAAGALAIIARLGGAALVEIAAGTAI